MARSNGVRQSLARKRKSLASYYPELTLRTEPAHREAFVALPDPDAGDEAVHWHLAGESLEAWADEQEQEHKGERLALTPEDLGLRITYLASALGTEEPLPRHGPPVRVER